MFASVVATLAVSVTLAAVMASNRRGRTLLKRSIRAGVTISRDARIPRGWRWALVIAFVAPIPGEFDELVGALILAIMWPRYKHVIREAWATSAA